MGGKAFSAAAVAAGLGVVGLAVTADALGLGAGGYAFGWEQKLGVAVGATVAWVGALRLAGWSPGRPGTSPDTVSARSAATASA
jgi:hypothetical protein